MKKVIQLLVTVLALNFLLIGGGIGWLYRSGHLNHDRIAAIKTILFPPATPATQPTTAPTTQTAAQPTLPLQKLLAAKSGMNASEQVQFLQRSFDAQMMELDRKQRDAQDLLDEVRKEQAAVSQQREALETAAKKLAADQAAAAKLAADKGFKESLERYNELPPKTVKQIFMQLDDTTVMHYLEAMEPRIAAGIIKEYKTPDEVTRIHLVLEMMRVQATTNPSAVGKAGAPGIPGGNQNGVVGSATGSAPSSAADGLPNGAASAGP